MNSMKSFVFVLTVSVLMFFSGCISKEEKELRLGMVQWVGYAPLYVAESSSLLPKKLHIIDFPSNYDILEAMKAGELNAACLTLDEVLKLQNDGMKLKILLVLDTSNGADAILASKEIQNVVQLKHKRVAYEPNSVQEYLLFRALEKNGLQFSDIKQMLKKFDEQESLWEQKKFDAVSTFEPFKHRLLQKGMHTIFSSTEIPNEIVDLLVVSQEALEESPLLIQKTIDAYFKGLEKLKKDPNSNAVIADYIQSNLQDTKTALHAIELKNRTQNLELLGNQKSILKSIHNIMRYFKQKEKNWKEKNIDSILYPQFIKMSKE